jgi:hypothetical protein
MTGVPHVCAETRLVMQQPVHSASSGVFGLGVENRRVLDSDRVPWVPVHSARAFVQITSWEGGCYM